MRFGHGVCVGLRGALAWRNSTLARSRAGLFSPPPFPPSLSLQLEEMCREQQASLGNGHGDLVEATAAWLGTQKDPEHRERWGPPGLRKNKELKKKKKNQRGEATQSRREDRRLWDVVQGPRSGFGG